MSKYEIGERFVYVGTEVIGLKDSAYRVWIERFVDSGRYEVIDQHPETHARFSAEQKTHDTYAQARAFADTLLQEQWDKEAESDRRRQRMAFEDDAPAIDKPTQV